MSSSKKTKWDKFERELRADVKKQGWLVFPIYTNGQGPDFAYTVGLYETFGHPEVVVFGGHPKMMGAILNVVGVRVRSGRRFRSGRYYLSVLQGYRCFFHAVPLRGAVDFLGAAVCYYRGGAFPVLQCVMPDVKGRFPWRKGVHPEFRELQPLLWKSSCKSS